MPETIIFENRKYGLMKKFIGSLLFIFVITAASAQTGAAGEALQFKETEHDFGNVPQGKPVTYSFEIRNTSNAPITLNNVQASCGCTTPEWSKDPIAPGAAAKIKVGFNAAAEGSFEKFISVVYNDSTQKQIKIRGNVWHGPVGAAPPNASVQFLKQQLP